MKTLNKCINKKKAAYKIGEALQITILRHGVTPGAIKQFRNIVKNHPDKILKAFLEGLLGVGNKQ